MSRGFGASDGAGTTDIITTALTAHSTTRSYGIWTYRSGDGGSGFGRLFDKTDTTHELFFNTGTTYEYRRAWTGAVGSIGQWAVTRPAADTWVRLLLVYDSTSSSNAPVIYFDGVSQSVTVLNAPAGSLIDNSSAYDVGNRSSDAARNWDGRFAEWAVWDAVLTVEEAVADGNGISPLLIRPGSLIDYEPMVRDNINLKGAASTITGTAVQPHPRVFYPRGHLYAVPSAGAASTQPPRSMHQFRLRQAA